MATLQISPSALLFQKSRGHLKELRGFGAETMRYISPYMPKSSAMLTTISSWED